MMQAIVVLLGSLCLSPVWLKPVSETRVASRNAKDALKLIEQTLTFMISEDQDGSHPPANTILADVTSSEWSWIDSLLTMYIQTGTPPATIPKSVLSTIVRHFAINEKFRGLVIREFASSKLFINFTMQAYSTFKEGLLQLFISSKEFRSNILQDVTCNEVGKLLKPFVSSLPIKSPGTTIKKFAQEEPFAWKVLMKWSDNPCFRSALIGRLVTSRTFMDHLEDLLSHSEALSESVMLGFIASEYFLSSLVTEYTKSDHLIRKLLQQYQVTQIFRDFLLDTLSNDDSFQQTVFDYLSTVELDMNTTSLDFKATILKQAIESATFRKAIFQEILSTPDFKKAILEAFSSSQQFMYAMVKYFARTDRFRAEVSGSQGMLDDAMQLFQGSESFRNIVLEIETAHVKM